MEQTSRESTAEEMERKTAELDEARVARQIRLGHIAAPEPKSKSTPKPKSNGRRKKSG